MDEPEWAPKPLPVHTTCLFLFFRVGKRADRLALVFVLNCLIMMVSCSFRQIYWCGWWWEWKNRLSVCRLPFLPSHFFFCFSQEEELLFSCQHGLPLWNTVVTGYVSNLKDAHISSLKNKEENKSLFPRKGSSLWAKISCTLTVVNRGLQEALAPLTRDGGA